MIPRASKLSVLVVLLLLSACGGGETTEPTSSLTPSTVLTTTVESSPASVAAVDGELPASNGEQSTQSDVTCSDYKPNQFQSNDEFLAEIPICVDIYIWPPEYPADPQRIVDRNSVPGMEIGGVEIGLAKAFVGSLNECSWLLTWSDAYKTGDTQRQAEVMQVMIDGVPFYIDPSQRGYPDDLVPKFVEDAELGDPTEVQSIVIANCEPAYWVADP